MYEYKLLIFQYYDVWIKWRIWFIRIFNMGRVAYCRNSALCISLEKDIEVMIKKPRQVGAFLFVVGPLQNDSVNFPF